MLQIVCAKYYELKKLHLVKVGMFAFDTASKFVLFSVSGLKDK